MFRIRTTNRTTDQSIIIMYLRARRWTVWVTDQEHLNEPADVSRLFTVHFVVSIDIVKAVTQFDC